MATFLLKYNFDGLATGAYSKFGNDTGATFVVSAADAWGNQTYSDSSFADGHRAYSQLGGYPNDQAGQLMSKIVAIGAASGGGSYGPILRGDGGQHEYRFFVDFNASATGTLTIVSKAFPFTNTIGTAAIPASGSNGFKGRAPAVGDWYWIKGECLGTTIRAKVWLVGTAEPAAWLLSVTDSSVASGIGGIYVSGTNTTVLDNLFFGDAGTTFTQFAAADDARLLLSGRWNVAGGKATTIYTGATIDVAYTGGFVNLIFDTTGDSGTPPDIAWQDTTGNKLRRTLSSTVYMIPVVPQYPAENQTATQQPAPAGGGRVRVWAEDIESASTNQWLTLSGALVLVGVESEIVQTAAGTTQTIEFLGDSVTASDRLLSSVTVTSHMRAASSGWTQIVASALGLRPIVTGIGGQGLTVNGSGATPNCVTAFPSVYNGASWSPTVKPSIVVLMQGYNDAMSSVTAATTFQTAYVAMLRLIRTTYPTALIYSVIPPNIASVSGSDSANYPAAITAAVAAVADARTTLVDASAWLSAIAGLDYSDAIAHINPTGAAKLGNRLASAIQTDINTRGGIVAAGGGSTVIGSSIIRGMR